MMMIRGISDRRDAGKLLPVEVAQPGVSHTGQGGLERGVQTPAVSPVETQPRLPVAMAAAPRPPKVVLS